MFQNRQEAGKLLATTINKQLTTDNLQQAVILALPRGGVVVGAEVGRALKIPLDIIVSRKIGSPGNPEYAIAACGKNTLVLNPRESPPADYLQQTLKSERQEISRREQIYRRGKPAIDIKNKTVILVDDGIATGLTMKAAILEIKLQKPKEIILAVPVAPADTIRELSKLVERTIILEQPEIFFSVGQFYNEFAQTTDEQVVEMLTKYSAPGQKNENH